MRLALQMIVSEGDCQSTSKPIKAMTILGHTFVTFFELPA